MNLFCDLNIIIFSTKFIVIFDFVVLNFHIMKNFGLVLPLLAAIIFSCKPSPNKVNEQKDTVAIESKVKEYSFVGQPIVPEAEIISNGKFWAYYSSNIELYEDFVAFDVSGNVIDKAKFLNEIKSGKYYPLAIYSKDEQLNYKLAKIPAKADQFISAYMRQFGSEHLTFYNMQGKPVPEFSFTDVNGKLYTSANTKGKIVLFKCWFIGCSACVAEMPALNQIVEKYKNRDDILFISLAMDPKKDLQNFLSKTKFDYATVPNQTKYMDDQLHVRAYPTHFLIDKKGNMVRALPDEVQVAEALEKEITK